MEDQIRLLLTNQDIGKIVFTVAASGIVFWVGLRLQNFIREVVAMRKITGSFDIAKCDVFVFFTPTGKRFLRLENIDRKRVHFRGKHTNLSIVTTEFVNMQWEVVRRDVEDLPEEIAELKRTEEVEA